MKRKIEVELAEWKKDPDRKILLVRGARQVGKTFSVRKLGQKFSQFLEVNLEETPEIHSFFEGTLNPTAICEKLSAYFDISIVPGQTLLFFDEIQACPNALRALRFFHEKMSDLHVVAAGSLLEFALSEIPSFGVGRIHSLFMYPLCFEEFVTAMGRDKIYNLCNTPLTGPADPTLHKKLCEYLKTYFVVGGMPQIVKTYVHSRDVNKCQALLDQLITTLKDDFSKYKKRVSTIKLEDTFHSIAYQTGGKFTYTHIAPGHSISGYKDSLEMLFKAGLAHKVRHTRARGLPLGAGENAKKFKVILFDVGVLQRELGLDLKTHLTQSDFDLVNKGPLAESFIGQEIAGHTHPLQKPKLFYWHRESKSSSAEIDYLIDKSGLPLPIEVKSGKSTRIKSVQIFLRERNLNRGVKLSLENVSDDGRILSIPLYSIGQLQKINKLP